ncbi:LysR family transcriptional regulator [Pararhizobium polonicum]|uniref:HTH-type transcriptional regulator TtuA n=1 Tax=Pararhizobium polonicum TaxID=1612624 RepID=A0A1C7NZ19_9HYPH|nr:LysR family transcriptional regulator [Pararhizobium polonicum]OBZ93986.1 LysR family transcriptional regulator [Pararhizobium polonicum]
MNDRLSGVSVFVEAVEADSFSAAAQRLNLSRSAVGKTIARLEDRLGARLFHRTTRSQTLTEDGQAFYERCLRALEELRAGEAMLESGRKEVVGRLRISMPVLFGRRCVAPILLKLAGEHPKLELDLNFTDSRVDIVEDGFDLAIRNGPLSEWPGLMTRRLSHQRMTVCASPEYLRSHGVPKTREELLEHPAILYARSGRIRSWLFPAESGPDAEILPRSRMRFDDLEMIADAAVAGLGIVWLPCWLVQERVRAGSLVRLFENERRLSFDCYAVWPKTPHLPLRVRLAIDALAARLPAATGL